MPLLWRHLLKDYLQILFLCMGSFISVLLVTRVTEIASFAASGAPITTILTFTLYLIPYILPLALPISCLIAALLLFQRLSHGHELTALRSCGLSLKKIAFPILFTGGILSLINFSVAAEIAPKCKTLSKELIYEMASLNPFVFFQKKSLIKLKDAYIDMESLKKGSTAKDIILILKNLSHERLGLVIAKKMILVDQALSGEKLSIISTAEADKTKEGFDHLIIENQEAMETPAPHITKLLYESDWHTSDEYLSVRKILAKRIVENNPFHLGHAEMEIVRRLSIALAAFSFTFLGIAFGVEISRSPSKKGIIAASLLALLFMICFIGAKSLHHTPPYACLMFLLPHIPLIFFSKRSLKKADRGIE